MTSSTSQSKQYGSRSDSSILVDQGADLFVEAMLANDVEYLFINSGTDTFPIQESLAKYMDRGQRVPEAVLCLDEKMGMAAAHGKLLYEQSRVSSKYGHSKVTSLPAGAFSLSLS
ncbi:MAG: hypothetical protein VB824_02160 [Dehalococcoidia bacterium]